MFAFKRSNSDNKVYIEGAQDLVIPPPSPEQSSTSPSPSSSPLPTPPHSFSGESSQREFSKTEDDIITPPSTPPPTISPSVQRRGSGVWTATGNNTISPFISRHEMVISFPTRESVEQKENLNHTLTLITDYLNNKKSSNLQITPTIIEATRSNSPSFSEENLPETPSVVQGCDRRSFIRPRRPATYNSEQLEPVDIPSDPDFSFLSKCDQNMIESAYHTVNRMESWDYLRRYSPSKDTGYIFDSDPTIGEITNAINDNWDGGHSGCSMGYTMRRIQYIANNGFQDFKQDYLACN
jgi:hypothetical protein